ncbi:hypothetical protein D3C76_1303180 [compost metagenome]
MSNGVGTVLARFQDEDQTVRHLAHQLHFLALIHRGHINDDALVTAAQRPEQRFQAFGRQQQQCRDRRIAARQEVELIVDLHQHAVGIAVAAQDFRHARRLR